MNERTKQAVTTLSVGLALNIALGVAKFVAGVLSHSNSVISDALNNISDAAVSVVTIVATCLAARGADHDHPYGHGRYEYIAAMLLGAVIIAVGAEVFTGGIKRAIEPQAVQADALMFSVLGASIAVKTFMAVFYYLHGKRVRSDTIKAASADSISDVAVTSVVLICAVIEYFTDVRIDGYVSIAVSVVILLMGLRIVKRTVSRLIGERPDARLLSEINDIIFSHPEVISLHDFMVNDYGENNKTAEADAVFDADMSFVSVHGVCDDIEREVFEKTGVRLSLHADPLVKTDARLVALQNEIDALLEAFDATAHDLEVSDEKKTVSLDVAVKQDRAPKDEIRELIRAQINKTFSDYEASVHFDYF